MPAIAAELRLQMDKVSADQSGPAASPSLQTGQAVHVHGLQSRPNLNGCSGVIVSDEANGRWAVQVQGVTGRLLLKGSNLGLLPPDSDDSRTKEARSTFAGSNPELLSMVALAKRAPEGPLVERARLVLLEHERRQKQGPPEAAATEAREQVVARLRSDSRVWQIAEVFSAGECSELIGFIEAAAARRGWNKLRHGKHPTTDMPLSAVPECEATVRSILFRRVLRALAAVYLPEGFLPEHLQVRDAFYVKYDAAPGKQRALELHTDGSIFSVNILLSDPDADFEGGGTFFEPSGVTVRPPRGACLGHSGQVRHSGVAISRGTRYLLVAFIGTVEEPYSLRNAAFAAHDAYLKFGDGAFCRREGDEAARELVRVAQGRTGRRRRPVELGGSMDREGTSADGPEDVSAGS